MIDILKGSTNYHFEDWIPQPEVLNHPKTKLFITHGGSNSFTESIEAKVPVLISPLGIDVLNYCEFIQIKQIGACLLNSKAQDIVKHIAEIESA